MAKPKRPARQIATEPTPTPHPTSTTTTPEQVPQAPSGTRIDPSAPGAYRRATKDVELVLGRIDEELGLHAAIEPHASRADVLTLLKCRKHLIEALALLMAVKPASAERLVEEFLRA